MKVHKDPFLSQVMKAGFFPLFHVVILWLVRMGEEASGFDLGRWGVYPRTASGLKGIFFSSFLHGGWDHLISNTFPLLILGAILFYSYRAVAVRTYLWLMFIPSMGIWLIGRPAFHIGASGMVYGLVGFIFFSGLIRNAVPLIALSLLVIFLYGGLVWYAYPLPMQHSWEGHISGAISGLILAIVYRKTGPQRKVFTWEDEEDDDDDPESTHTSDESPDSEIIYHYKEKPDQAS